MCGRRTGEGEGRGKRCVWVGEWGGGREGEGWWWWF